MKFFEFTLSNDTFMFNTLNIYHGLFLIKHTLLLQKTSSNLE